ncbi:MAG: hypothetical protein DHS20C18_17890 [Saprospiraceae bacterium]|nr:MAG: hypothetical protein DHS20C18_17890 [Saprospiraceae bacterium]
MKRNYLLSLLAVFGFVFLANAQNPIDLNPCGSVSGKSTWLKKYQASPQLYQKNTDTIIYVPLTIHLLGTDAGQGFFPYNKLLDALCVLNQDFEQANIQFFVEGDLNLISNSAWNDHETVLDGAEMMFANNVANTLNCYFLSDPAGNCGYNLPYAGIAVAKSCADAADHTWSHEVGHALSLPHPFLGWEGGPTHDGNINTYNFNNPAPLTVTYDYTYFKDTLIIDTLIIDTIAVEMVDQSNCTVAADGFCDTPPDYLSYRWQCNSSSPESSVLQRDPNGDTFRSDGTLIMSYADDACSYRFSDDQIAAMRANLYDEKPELLYNQTPADAIAEIAPNQIYPINGEAVAFNQAELAWDEVENAIFYSIEISRVPTFSSAITDKYWTSSTNLILPELDMDRTYYWRVRAANSHYFCTPRSESATFVTISPTATSFPANISRIVIAPNPVNKHGKINITLDANEQMPVEILLSNTIGARLQTQQFTANSGLNQWSIELDTHLPGGIYLLSVQTSGGIYTEKVIVE